MNARNALLAAAFVLLTTSCSHGNLSRAPSSEPASEASDRMENTLEALLKLDDPKAESKAYVERLLKIRLRAHAWMLETDQAFRDARGPVSLFDQPSYRRLLVARPLVEHTQEKIAAFYGDAVRMARTVATDPDRAAKAGLVVAGVHEALLSAHHDPAQRLLLNDLLGALREARGPSVLPHPLLQPLEGEALYAAAAAAQGALRSAAEALPETDEVKEEIERRVQEVAPIEPTQDREPQALNVYPSIDSHGNIDGFTFPRGTWAVTFDDGPNPQIDAQDLANLQAAHQKATFFWLAKNVILYGDDIKKVQAAGMPVENHSWNHPQLNSPRDLARLHTDLNHEINDSTVADTKAYGVKPKFFRCPYGAGFNDPTIRGLIAKQGMIHVRWNVDSLDWQDPNPVTVQARVEQQMKANGRGIILFHDIHTPAIKVVPNLFAKYKGQLRWVSIPQIVDELNGVTHAPDAGGVPSGN